MLLSAMRETSGTGTSKRGERKAPHRHGMGRGCQTLALPTLSNSMTSTRNFDHLDERVWQKRCIVLKDSFLDQNI